MTARPAPPTRALAALLACCALLAAPACGPSDSAGRTAADGPDTSEWTDAASVIFILVDTLRADHTSVNGHRMDRDTTPFLRSLADESFVFERAYVNASWTRASMASVFSSRLPRSHGCETRDGLLVPEIVTWPEVLQENGWATHAVVTNGNVLPEFGFGQGFDHFDHVRDWPRNEYADAWKLREPILRAVDRLRGQRAMFWLHYVDPHDPYLHHDDADFNPAYDGPIDGTQDTLQPYNWSPPPMPDRREVIDLYDGEILWFDRQLATLFERLEQRGLLEQSWVVITSDHGEGLWDHRIRAHGQEIFEEQIHVPLILRPPGGLERRRAFAEPMALLDLGPTLLELLEQPVPASFEGRSWADALRGTGAPPVRPIEIHELLDHTELYGIIDGTHKLIVDRDPKKGSIRYYDLAANPSEDPARALDLREGRSATATRLQRLLEEGLATAAARRPAGTLGGGGNMSPELREQLEALGYLGDGPPPDEDDADEDAATDEPAPTPDVTPGTRWPEDAAPQDVNVPPPNDSPDR